MKIRFSVRAGSGIAAILTVFAVQSLFLAPNTMAQEGEPLSERIFEKANWVFETARVSHYKHNKVPASEQVRSDGNSCDVESDCSGFVSYVIDQVAPRHYEVVRNMQTDRPYPQAKIWAKFLTELEGDKHGWRRIDRISELRRGDVLAWAKERIEGRGNTGHVVFVDGSPSPPEMIAGFKCVSVPVLDCSSVEHFQPERLPPRANQSHRDGIGKGIIRLVVNDDNQPIGYWEGSYSGEKKVAIDKPSLSHVIGLGRMIKNE